MYRLISVTLISVFLFGCTVTAPIDSTKSTSEAGSLPDNYKTIITHDVKVSYFDPYSIRSAEITAPFLQNHSILGHFWAVCVRANGKNRMGAYVGIKTEAYVFRHGKLLQKSTHPEDYCNNAQFQPFTELESIF